jgi:hypothetical protein
MSCAPTCRLSPPCQTPKRWSQSGANSRSTTRKTIMANRLNWLWWLRLLVLLLFGVGYLPMLVFAINLAVVTAL